MSRRWRWIALPVALVAAAFLFRTRPWEASARVDVTSPAANVLECAVRCRPPMGGEVAGVDLVLYSETARGSGQFLPYPPAANKPFRLQSAPTTPPTPALNPGGDSFRWAFRVGVPGVRYRAVAEFWYVPRSGGEAQLLRTEPSDVVCQ